MTAIILYATRETVKIMSDRAAYSEDGTIGFFFRKTIQLHDHPIVLAARGDVRIAENVLTGLHSTVPPAGEISTSEAMVLVGNYFYGLRQSGLKAAEFLIAAMTGDGPEVRFVPLHDGYSDKPPFISHRPMPSPEADSYEFVMLGPDVCLPMHHHIGGNRNSLEELGVEAMTLMRAEKAAPPAMSLSGWTAPMYGVGGGIDCATLTCDSVTFAEVLTWPDQIGKKISPTQSEVV